MKTATVDAADSVAQVQRSDVENAPEKFDEGDNEGENGNNGSEHQIDRSTQGKESRTDCIERTDVRMRLPDHVQTAEPDFHWGVHKGEDFLHIMECSYAEIAHWRRNIFMVPSGNVGKDFIRELTSLFSAYAQGSALESVALTAVMVACGLLLQKPHLTSKTRDHVTALERRLRAWREGDIDGLMKEGRTIQNHLRPPRRREHGNQEENDSRIFSKLILEGKIHSALRFLSQNHGGGVLNINDSVDGEGSSVLDTLRSKHPPPGKLDTAAFVTTDLEPPEVHPILFDCLTGQSIRNAALRTQGSAGPSGVDASGWRRMCTGFHRHSADLCASIAAVARRLATQFVDPAPLTAYLACRLIPLDKKPGVRPIGICEVLRRIIGKSISTVVKDDVRNAAGPLQLCCGHEGGCEAAVRAMKEVFAADNTDGILLVDASNAFNNLNRQVALFNIRYICPAIATVLINCYRDPVSLFVGGTTLLSKEGTTQGDPLAMMMFGLATLPLINATKLPDTIQCWFADDAAAGSRLVRLREWWNLLTRIGPLFGYFPNSIKTCLVVKPGKYTEAVEVFSSTNVEITCSGRRYLGGTIGTYEFELTSMQGKVSEWQDEVKRLARIAQSRPHAAYAAFTHGLTSRWTYAVRVSTIASDEVVQPLAEAIVQHLIPALTMQPVPCQAMRDLLALPSRLGGIGLINPVKWGMVQQANSAAVSQPLSEAIIRQRGDMSIVTQAQHAIKARLLRQQRTQQRNEADDIICKLSNTQQKCARAAQEKGSSAWLAAIPITRMGFSLHKGEFWDALCLRYGWELRFTPQNCRCGAPFETNHVLTCMQGGFHTIRHNDVRDTIATILQEVCHEVTTEPSLQPLNGEILPPSANKDDHARLDIKVRGFWNGSQDAYFDVRVFHPFAPSYQASHLSAIYRQHETQKRSAYGRRIRDIEHGCFTPLVFATNGGTAPEATIFLKRLASMLAEKKEEKYATTMGWLRCVLGFCLLRSSLRCLRASQRKAPRGKVDMDHIAEAMATAGVPY